MKQAPNFIFRSLAVAFWLCLFFNTGYAQSFNRANDTIGGLVYFYNASELTSPAGTLALSTDTVYRKGGKGYKYWENLYERNGETVQKAYLYFDKNDRVYNIIFMTVDTNGESTEVGYAMLAYYKNGTLKAEDYYLKGAKDYFLSRTYYENGKLYEQRDRRNKTAQRFYENGVAVCNCQYDQQERSHGVISFYYENGKLRTTVRNEHGKLIEVLEYRDPDGKPLDPGTVKNGNGILNQYDDKGKPAGKFKYVDGKEKGKVK